MANQLDVRTFRKNLVNEFKINANKQGFYSCYERCANKQLILDLYNSENNEIIFGRRGTGKTTVLKGLSYYVNQMPHEDENFCYAIYIDMEDIVPNKIEFASLPENYSREVYRLILLKIIERFYNFYDRISQNNSYYNLVFYSSSEIEDIADTILKLDETVKEGSTFLSGKESTNNSIEETVKSNKKELMINGHSQNRSLFLNLSAAIKNSFTNTHSNTVSVSKKFEYTININEIRKLFSKLLLFCKIENLFLCFDEFTIVDKDIPQSIQIEIAQLIKDTFFRDEHITVKISSLWNKEKMQRRYFGTDRRGMELGNDIKSSVDLDEIFFNSSLNAETFFAELLGNILLSNFSLQNYNRHLSSTDNIVKQREISINAGNTMIDKLFKTRNAYYQMVCGSQGIPRVFGNLLINCIANTDKLNELQITFNDVQESIISNYLQSVTKKLPEGMELLHIIEEFISNNKTRFFLINIKDYKKIQHQIEGLVDANALHQYPSSNMDRKLRHRYKLFLVHYGNYIEALKTNSCNSSEFDKQYDAKLYPLLPDDLFSNPLKYELIITEEVFNQKLCPQCKQFYFSDELTDNNCPNCNSPLL